MVSCTEQHATTSSTSSRRWSAGGGFPWEPRPLTPAAARSTSAQGAWPSAAPRNPVLQGQSLRRARAPHVLRGRPDGQQPARQTVAASSCCVAVGRCGYVPPEEAHAPRAGQHKYNAVRTMLNNLLAGGPLRHLETPNSARQHDPEGGAGAQGRPA